MKPTDAPGFENMLDKLCSAKDDRPRYLVPGWHELAIDRCVSMQERRSTETLSRLFIVEGRVLRSTAPGFAGERWSYVGAMKFRTAFPIMEQIVNAAANLNISRVANDVEQCLQYNICTPDRTETIEPAVMVLAEVTERQLRSGHTVFLPRFEAQS